MSVLLLFLLSRARSQHQAEVDRLITIRSIEQRFLHALNYCMLLPGPEAMQLATYAGWLLHGTLGGVMAGLLFVLPGAAVMLLLSGMYASLHSLGWVAALFFGVKAAVVVIVIEALLKVSRRALHRRAHVALAVAAFLLLFLFNAPFPLVILAAAVAGSFLPVAPKADEVELEGPGGRVQPVVAGRGVAGADGGGRLQHHAGDLPRVFGE